MIRIAITPNKIRRDECEYISTILDAGWDRVHIRHPHIERDTLEKILKGLSASHRSRVMIHSHFSLAKEYGCGIHLNKRCRDIPNDYNGEVSQSLHSIKSLKALNSSGFSVFLNFLKSFGNLKKLKKDLKRKKQSYSYVTLSPIFASISKPGYSAQWDFAELKQSLADTEVPVVALGGITPDKAAWLKNVGFDGYAVLGYLNEAQSIEELRMRLREFNE